MARLALHLPIFIASPGDAGDERDVIEGVVEARARRAANHDVFLRPVRWEKDARPTVGRPQEFINRMLEKCELTVVIFREREGSAAGGPNGDTGSWEELMLAMDLVRSGKLDDVFLYYFRGTGAKPTNSPLRDRLEELFKAHRIFAYEYRSIEDLQKTFERHIDHWLDTWEQVPRIASFTLQQVAPARLAASQTGQGRLVALTPLLAEFGPDLVQRCGQLAVTMYQKYGPDDVMQTPVPIEQVPRELVTRAGELPPHYQTMRRFQIASIHECPFAFDKGSLRWSDEEWFHLFCAIGVKRAICARDYRPVEHKPYINPVHQFVPAIAQGERSQMIEVLTEWLSGIPREVGTKPIVRNFAAYVLGMLNAIESQDALARACQDDPGQDVRLYSVTSLGKVRSRRYLDLLVEQFARASEPRLRLTIGQAICRIIGIAEYEL